MYSISQKGKLMFTKYFKEYWRYTNELIIVVLSSFMVIWYQFSNGERVSVTSLFLSDSVSNFFFFASGSSLSSFF